MKNLILFGFLILLSFSCSDDAAERNQVNNISANIGGEQWISENTHTRKETGENGPLMIVGEGDGYTLQLVLTGISAPGEYTMGTNRNGTIEVGNTTYNTLDVQDAGTITITRYEDNNVEGEFEFDAQWLSANNRIQVREGKFKIFYY